MELHRVRALQSYVSADRRRMICIFEAPDAESVRKANTTAVLQFDRVWTAESLFADKTQT